jgi:hypothetical protein
MEKILRKYTTIPDHLYVERNADKQLKNIIEEMERPGYVLVSRQMGKTNLLFNAIRKLENKDRIFAYVDLSNLFSEEIECYRNIIDSIIEPNEELFGHIENEIYKIRDLNLPPNREYSKSLNILLKEFGGKIIIVLDEIDALRSINYSDHIFAQIRSTYFARTKQPIFNKLSYILSGVIEPTELIKDRNKSPFNIGEKIYLDDFTFEEHNDFIEKSKLKISNSISEFIYSWTNGNPRLTFDICADIEDKIIENKIIDEKSVSNLIRNKYLINYDIPPIDHIRELVISNKKVRDAVKNIQNGINNLSDEIKRKLYLYGIISSNFNEKTVIKNKIISESLSIEWIDTLEKESKVTLSSALVLYENLEYEKAKDALLKILENTKKEEELDTCYYLIANCYYRLKAFSKAIEYFSYDFKNEKDKRSALSFLGTCKLVESKEEGLEYLENVIKIELNDFAYHNALLNISINIQGDNPDRAYELLDKLYLSTFVSEDSEEDELNNLRTLALYYQSTIDLNNSNKENSLKKIEEALKYSSISNSLFLMYLKYLLSEKQEIELRDKIVNSMIDGKITFDKTNNYPISFSETHLLYYISLSYDKNNLTLFEKLIDYSKTLFNDNNIYELVYKSALITSINKEQLLLYVLNKKEELNNETLYFNTLRHITNFYANTDDEKYEKYFKEYMLIHKNQQKIDSEDIYLYAIHIKYILSKNSRLNLNRALELCEIIDSKLKDIEDNELINESLIIYYWYATIYMEKDYKEKSLEYANKTLFLLKNTKKTSALDEEGILSITKQMNQIRNHFTIRIPIKSSKKYGRNDKVHVEYSNGIKKYDKYKKFESDINLGICVITEK